MDLIKEIQEMKHEMTRWRQKLHAEPELSFEERGTARYITKLLQSFGIETHALTKTGVVGVLRGKGNGEKAIMLRVNMDAFPAPDETGASYASRNAGVHHATGHDGDMAMLMGAAKHLAQTKNFDGTIYFVFQPASEFIGGAKEMVRDGLFGKFPCGEVYGLRNSPDMPLGTMAAGSGPVLQAWDEFHVSFSGKGGSIIQLHDTVPAVSAAAEVVLAAKEMLKREISENRKGSLAVSSLSAGSEGSGTLQGIIRSFDPALQDSLKQNLKEIVSETAEKYDVAVKIEFKNPRPPLVNTPVETDFALSVAKDLVGEGKIVTPPPLLTETDDFSHYLQSKPGNLMSIGTGKKDGSAPLYSAKYDFNDAALPLGASYWVHLAEKALPLSSAAAKPVSPKPPSP